MNSNVRYNDVTLPPELSEKYKAERIILYQRRVTEFGTFDRREPGGYTIPREQYDSLVTKCCVDEYSMTSDPFRILGQITRESRCPEFEQLVGNLKDALVHEKKGTKWSRMITAEYKEINFKDSDEKTIAIMQLNNMINTLRHHIAQGQMNYQEAIMELKPFIDQAIDKSQNKTFWGRIGLTHSDVAKQLTTFKKEFLEFKDKVKEITLPGKENDDNQQDLVIKN
ncbi:TPA: hypothetical protein ACPSKY_000575 [Legionella bozemanae]|uniref:hypothetical protein n=1 Tax=Legionella bozemanae TaxID=447 RepID=UPI0010417A4D|nr:hypothetical protein [Legionella bozemanae]